jgi:restriction system protein
MQVALDEILINSLYPEDLDLNELKDFSIFPEPIPQQPTLVIAPVMPLRSDKKYNPSPPFLVKLSKKKMMEFNKHHTTEYEKDFSQWKTESQSIEMNNRKKIQNYEISIKEWDKKRVDFEQSQTEKNQEIDLLFKQYTQGKTESVENYFRLVLEKIDLPFSYSRSVEVEYDSMSKTIIIDLFLPVIDDIPNLKHVRYIKSRKEYKESFYPDSYLKKKYDSVIYQIVLQTLNYVLSLGSKHNLVDSVVINGKVNTVDKTTGKSIEPYILSVNVAKAAFDELNLEGVDAKAWFKSAKGVSAASLANVTPVAPIVTMSREDIRFVDGYEVSESLDDSVNLAAIDWQDFENLVREIFDREFNVNGGEVKITRASRDGGVDAVAFDPDPIRGGKIVIQAKRYTNVVGVSAVRDLFGTVLNEGATKGILVTTSNYGNDAYTFAQGKPLTLLNGAELLHLLEKHGYRARINLSEAKEILRG